MRMIKLRDDALVIPLKTIFTNCLRDDALVLPLKTIFTNCLRRGSFPEIWKCAHAVPVHMKNENI